jgi:hypothetical protein
MLSVLLFADEAVQRTVTPNETPGAWNAGSGAFATGDGR